jgi:hypothetical protein
VAPKWDPKIVKKVDFWVFQKAREVGRFLGQKWPKTVEKCRFFPRLRRDFFQKMKNPALIPPARKFLNIDFQHNADAFGQKRLILA